jgi:hypothetical protein
MRRREQAMRRHGGRPLAAKTVGMADLRWLRHSPPSRFSGTAVRRHHPEEVALEVADSRSPAR